MRDFRIRESIPNLIGMLFRRMARVHGRAIAPFELSSVQAHILMVLWSHGEDTPMTIGELQAELALGSSTLTGAIDRMEKSGLVRRAPIPGDRRAVGIVPVTWPAARRARLVETLAETERACFARLTPGERKELHRLLDKANQSIAAIDDLRDVRADDA